MPPAPPAPPPEVAAAERRFILNVTLREDMVKRRRELGIRLLDEIRTQRLRLPYSRQQENELKLGGACSKDDRPVVPRKARASLRASPRASLRWFP